MASKEEEKNKKTNFLLRFSGFLIIILIIGLLIGYKIYYKKIIPEKKVIAEVGREKIYQSELNDLIYSLNYHDENLDRFGNKAGDIKNNLIEALIEYKILKIKAKGLGIEISQEEILKEARNSLRDFDKYDQRRKKITMQEAEFSLLQNKVAEKVVNWREGKFILVRGDLHFYPDPTGLSEKEREKLIPEDLDYARNLVNYIYKKIEKREISFEEGMEIANQDKKTGKPAWGEWKVTFSQSFSKEDSILKSYPIGAVNFWDEIFKAKIGEISKPVPIKKILNENSPIGLEGKEVDAFYLIIKVEKGNIGEANSYNAWIEKQKQELGVKIY